MAQNFYRAGLEFLLQQGFFNEPERAFLKWLLEASKESAAVYYDSINAIPPGSDLDRVRDNVKAKCRYFMLQDIFQEMKAAYP